MRVEIRQVENSFLQFTVSLVGLAKLQTGKLVFEAHGDVEFVSAYSGHHEYELSASRFTLRLTEHTNVYEQVVATIDATGNVGSVSLLAPLSELIANGEDILVESNVCSVQPELITDSVEDRL